MYYFVFALLYLLSLLPLPLLYLVSDFFYVLLYHIIRYRRAVVAANLLIAFPEKSPAERKTIEKEYFRHFCDNWIESIKLLSIPETAIRKRVTADLGALETVHTSGRSCHILLGHMFNWEWGNALVTLASKYQLLCVYAPQSSKIVDRLFLHLRRRFGSVLLPFNDMRRAMLPYRHSQFALALMADQSPPGPEKAYWVDFFGRPTAFLQGPERGARLGKMPVVFLTFGRPRRGYYHLQATLLTDDAGQTREAELTTLYAQTLEANIRQHPAGYLWSHRRWKLVKSDS
jgi:KDO2-lipid IV(A) lauroyltransferase